ncbi:phosphatase [Halothermothrix orenii]|uniref:PHP domain protein n=1 Tax=Halothermothrix orenii (strain H 168 / OCM 544 / DSM 9562) TaxID=373903 RepID=B8D0P3_HALOH|nr:PHP domain-containing protein [Halothermothrix orenii]ACL70979.1 PHP domain protein [Halothermothrix orenii H 168]
MPADLHIHSTYSDGSYTPAELVSYAAKKGLKTIAVADHDTVEGVAEALKYGRERGIEVIPAIEFSTFRKKAEIHILGYFIDYNNNDFLAEIDKIYQARLNRARKMVEKLNELGVEISYEEVRNLAGDDYVGRPHIARAMIKKGYITEMGEAFTDDYIGNNGRAYVPKYQLSPERAIQLIKEADGIPVLAHPHFINRGDPLKKEEISRLVEGGLEGIEVYHSKHSEEVSNYYLGVARELDLLITGGSDFHGDNSPDIDMGDVVIEDSYVDRLKAHWGGFLDE